MDFIFSPPSSEDLTRLLKAWRFWVLMTLLGGLLGAILYAVAPPPYRARATVLVDFNIEQAWVAASDRQAFYYLEREVRKLIDIAWSDEVMQVVSESDGAASVSELRDGKLSLSQPREAGWSFWAEDEDPQRAQSLAAAWAQAFTARVQQGVTASMTLQAFQAEIQNGCGGNCAEIESQIADLEARSLGVSPYIETSITQQTDLPISRRVGLDAYILSGAVSVLCVGALLVLFFKWKPRRA